jgi:hypothetical protein
MNARDDSHSESMIGDGPHLGGLVDWYVLGLWLIIVLLVVGFWYGLYYLIRWLM